MKERNEVKPEENPVYLGGGQSWPMGRNFKRPFWTKVIDIIALVMTLSLVILFLSAIIFGKL